MNTIRSAKMVRMIAVLFVTALSVAQAQTFTTIANLYPKASHLGGLIQANDGRILGFAPGISGEIVGMGLSGHLSAVYTFCTETGCPTFPVGIFQAANDMIYGTSETGGANSKGALYAISPKGEQTVLYSFCSQANCTDGWNPYSAPAPGIQGGQIGTTFGGGANAEGILYEASSADVFTPLYSFCAQTNCTDGAGPSTTPFQTANGTIYGTTDHGGTNNIGTIYSYTSTGGLTTMYSFPTSALGSAGPILIQGANGNFYGVTLDSGSGNNGSFFRITPQGKFTTLYSFCVGGTPCGDGAGPTQLIQGSDGNFYGITSVAGANGSGTVFQVTPQGVLTTLHSFCSEAKCADGNGPQSLMQDTDGTFYGTTEASGAHGGGTAFSLSIGLAPFVQANPGWGAVGAEIGIQGNNLTGTTSVTFNGTPATFTVAETYLKVQVPTGATSGTIQVTTPSGTLTSNFPFQVLP
jgi:uncharacterized repeat protein (TIGR03803 family)